jgi:hypothetical protein
MSASLNRLLEAAEKRIAERFDRSPSRHRVKWALRLYGSPSHPAAVRLAENPADSARIAEYRLDTLLAGVPRILDMDMVAGVRIEFALSDALASIDSLAVAMVRLELDPDPRHEAEFFDRQPRIQPTNARFPRVWVVPITTRSEALTIDGRNHPESWEEAYWLAGQGDGLYLARKGDERQAIRSTAGKVEARGFAESWRLIGTVAT